MHESPQKEPSKHWEHQNQEITTTLTAPGTVGTAVGRDVWSKILGKTSVEKLETRVAVLKTERCSTGDMTCTVLKAM